MKKSSGIYVEIEIEDELDHVWLLTQDPNLHQRWDLRFSRIQYLPRPSLAEPQSFLYETRIAFGLSIKGTGESVGQCASAGGDTTSSLKFASADPKSLIREGSGYWRYIPRDGGLRFLTWYDYRVRFGGVGRLADRLAFRPLIGWGDGLELRPPSYLGGDGSASRIDSNPRPHSRRRPALHRNYLDLAWPRT
jgi:hypothetical protein